MSYLGGTKEELNEVVLFSCWDLKYEKPTLQRVWGEQHSWQREQLESRAYRDPKMEKTCVSGIEKVSAGMEWQWKVQ